MDTLPVFAFIDRMTDIEIAELQWQGILTESNSEVSIILSKEEDLIIAS